MRCVCVGARTTAGGTALGGLVKDWAGYSYEISGYDAGVWGDGITPLESALGLPGAVARVELEVRLFVGGGWTDLMGRGRGPSIPPPHRLAHAVRMLHDTHAGRLSRPRGGGQAAEMVWHGPRAPGAVAGLRAARPGPVACPLQPCGRRCLGGRTGMMEVRRYSVDTYFICRIWSVVQCERESGVMMVNSC